MVINAGIEFGLPMTPSAPHLDRLDDARAVRMLEIAEEYGRSNRGDQRGGRTMISAAAAHDELRVHL